MLTYKGESQFSTFFGGTVSIMIISAVFIYMSVLMRSMLNRENSNNTLSTQIIDLNTQDQDYYLDDYGFGFGVSITDLTGRPVVVDPSYFTLSIYQITTVKSGNYYPMYMTSLGTKLCDSKDLPNISSEYLSRGLDSSLYCPVNKRYKVAGNYLSNNYQFISVKITKCIGTGCKSTTEINLKLKSIAVSLLILNSYMDFNDFSSPIKTYIDDTNIFYISSSYVKAVKVYLRQNEANLNDDYMMVNSAINRQFFSTDKTIVDIADVISGESINISLFLSPNKNTYTRVVYSIMDLFGNVGGVYGIMQIICSIVVSMVSYEVMMSSIFRRLYFTHKLNLNTLVLKSLDFPKKFEKKQIEEMKKSSVIPKPSSMFLKQEESKFQSEVDASLNENELSS